MVQMNVRVPPEMKREIEEAAILYNRRFPGRHDVSSVVRFAVRNLFHPDQTQMGLDAQDDE